MVYHQPTLDAMQAKGMQLNEARKRMALFPENSLTLLTPEMWVNIIKNFNSNLKKYINNE